MLIRTVIYKFRYLVRAVPTVQYTSVSAHYQRQLYGAIGFLCIKHVFRSNHPPDRAGQNRSVCNRYVKSYSSSLRARHRCIGVQLILVYRCPTHRPSSQHILNVCNTRIHLFPLSPILYIFSLNHLLTSSKPLHLPPTPSTLRSSSYPHPLRMHPPLVTSRFLQTNFSSCTRLIYTDN